MEHILFFSRPEEFGNWLRQNHARQTEQWVGFYKIKSGIPSMTWSESVDQALCFGWIDGLRKSIDEESYRIRFSPRKPRSHWSAINLEKMKMLMAENLVSPAGMAAYENRDKQNAEKASYEQKELKLTKAYEAQLKEDPAAWAFFQCLPPSIRRPTIWWVVSAKQEVTRQKRLGIMIASASRGERIPLLRWSKKK